MTAPTATPRTGELLYSSIEEDLRSTVRGLLDKRSNWTDVLARTETDDTTDRTLWATLAAEVGCVALAVPEELGGGGAGWREAAVVAEELGRALAPVPFLGSAGIATAVLLEIDDHDLLPKLAAGEISAVLALPFGTLPGERPGGVELREGILTGSVAGVSDAGVADVVLVAVDDALIALRADAPGVIRTPVVSLDMTRPLTDFEFVGVEATVLASGPDVVSLVERALQIGAVLLASEQLGLAERCLEMTVEYLTVRRQFSRIVGSYQALKHRLADVWVLVSQARAVARYAAECATTDSPDLPVAAALAQAHCSVVAQQAAEECIQLHGGIGFTWEHPAHLYLKRAKADAIGLGTPDRHRAALGVLIDVPRSSSRGDRDE